MPALFASDSAAARTASFVICRPFVSVIDFSFLQPITKQKQNKRTADFVNLQYWAFMFTYLSLND